MGEVKSFIDKFEKLDLRLSASADHIMKLQEFLEELGRHMVKLDVDLRPAEIYKCIEAATFSINTSAFACLHNFACSVAKGEAGMEMGLTWIVQSCNLNI